MNGALNQQVCFSRSESPAKEIRVEEYNDFGALASIQQEWDDFVELVGGGIFMTYDWCRVWWKYYGKNRDLMVFVFRSNSEIVGIIPLFFEKLWLGPILIRAAKIVGSDFTLAQFSLPIHSMHIKRVIQKLFELLSESKRDIMHIGPIAGLYKHYDCLKTAFEESFGSSCFVLSEQKNVQTYFQLADNWEDQLSSLSKNERGNIRRNYNVIRKASSDPSNSLKSCFAAENNFTEFFNGFVEMHQSHWNKLGMAGHFKDWPFALEFHHELAKTQLKLGRLRLLKVSMGSDCFGYQYHFKFGDRFCHFLDARSDPSMLKGLSLGRITLCELIKKVLQEKVKCVDSMRGKYEHKLRLGGKLFPIRSIYIFSKKLSVSLRVFLFRALASFLNLCYYRIWYCRIAPKLPLRHRPLWRIWVRISGFSW